LHVEVLLQLGFVSLAITSVGLAALFNKKKEENEIEENGQKDS